MPEGPVQICSSAASHSQVPPPQNPVSCRPSAFIVRICGHLLLLFAACRSTLQSAHACEQKLCWLALEISEFDGEQLFLMMMGSWALLKLHLLVILQGGFHLLVIWILEPSKVPKDDTKKLNQLSATSLRH
ncbi:hypothetical protein L1887_30036 [Cichorium endivia]|nr:hypothetical protein L1887_30036 [Cichorium endivia]